MILMKEWDEGRRLVLFDSSLLLKNRRKKRERRNVNCCCFFTPDNYESYWTVLLGSLLSIVLFILYGSLMKDCSWAFLLHIKAHWRNKHQKAEFISAYSGLWMYSIQWGNIPVFILSPCVCWPICVAVLALCLLRAAQSDLAHSGRRVKGRVNTVRARRDAVPGTAAHARTHAHTHKHANWRGNLGNHSQAEQNVH